MSEASTLEKPTPTQALEPVWAAQFDAPINHVVAAEGAMVFLCGDGTAHFVSEKDMGEGLSTLHRGAILTACATPLGLLTGGDDGRVVVSTSAQHSDVISEHDGLWINAVASSHKGELAWSAGKQCYRLPTNGKTRSLECSSTPADIAFDRKGNRLAIALYGGVWLWLPKPKDDLVRRLEWKGSHLRVSWSLDSAIVVSTMQEKELHGWRLSDGANMRMSGYPGKITSMSWNSTGERLATSGAPSAVLWPFDHGGPWQRRPDELGFFKDAILKLSFHPSVPVLAAGCRAGELKIIRTTDGSEMNLGTHRHAAVSALAWSRSGHWLASGTDSGRAEIYSFAKS
jgi:WD40 repeat protein